MAPVELQAKYHSLRNKNVHPVIKERTIEASVDEKSPYK
jgi:hypothetical protein